MRFIIIGGGGFRLKLYTYFACDIQSVKLPKNCTIEVLDKVANCELMARICNANYLGWEQEFVPSEGDRVLIAIGSAAGRKRAYKTIQDRQIQLGTHIHSSAWAPPSANLGKHSSYHQTVLSVHSRKFRITRLSMFFAAVGTEPKWARIL